MAEKSTNFIQSFSQDLLKVKAKSTNEIKHIFKLKNDIFVNGKPLPFSLYSSKDKRWVKVHNKDAIFSIDQALLKDAFLLEEDTPNFESYILDNFRDIFAKGNPDVADDVKRQVVYSSLGKSINTLLEGPTKDKVEKVKEYASDLIDIISSSDVSVQGLSDLMSHDYYTYTHSTNVSIYTLLLYQNLDISKSAEVMKKIAQGAILHDIGKSFVPLEIVNKPAKLTDEEFKIMKEHPLKGVEYLKSIGEKDKEILDIVGQHHEDFDGSGYPFGLKGEMISMYGKISAIADVFDALTTKRSYKTTMTSFEAIKLMMEKMRHRFDPRYFKVFIKIMSA